MSKRELINNAIQLEELFASGLQQATKLRKELEGVSTPSTRTGNDLSVYQKQQLRDKRMRTFKGATSHRNALITKKAGSY